MAITPFNPIDLAQQICASLGLTFIGEVGEGAFKKTYLIRSKESDFALKLIIRGADGDRVEREIAALKACNHKNVGKLIHSGSITHNESLVVYLVEEYLHGGTLGNMLTNGCLLSPEIKFLAINLTEAISHLADIAITHRDIKPENIMFRNDGTPVLVDLGIARHLQADSLTKTFMLQGPGTPLFAAPEQLLNDKNLIDWRTDQFSLGITLSYAAFGFHPFSVDNSLEKTVDRVASRLRPSDYFIESAKEANLEILVKMVEPWPINRFTHPEGLLNMWHKIGGENGGISSNRS